MKFIRAGWLLAIGLFIATCLCETISLAQNAASASGDESATASNSQSLNAQPLNVRAGTKISAELQSAVDACTAKPGDQVAARVTNDVKEHGRAVIHKGDRLLGHVTSVEAATKGKANAGSALAVTFDRLEQGGGTYSLNTVINSIFSARADQEGDGSMMHPGLPPGVGPAGGGAGRPGGGVLGGVASMAGAVGGATTNATNSTVGGLKGTVSGTTNSTLGGTAGAGLAAPLSSIRVTSEAQSHEQSGATSVLSARYGDIRLDSGTRIQFRVTGEGEAAAAAKR